MLKYFQELIINLIYCTLKEHLFIGMIIKQAVRHLAKLEKILLHFKKTMKGFIHKGGISDNNLMNNE